MIPVKALCGVGSVPGHRTSASQWLRQAGIPLHIGTGNGGRFEYVLGRDLPTEVRRAYELRDIDNAGLPAGEYDDAAHDRFAEATPTMQATALRKAEIARFLIKCGGSYKGLPGMLCNAAREVFGSDGTDKMTLRRILRAVEGVDPVNFAPALLPAYAREGKAAEMSPEAWAFFHDHYPEGRALVSAGASLSGRARSCTGSRLAMAPVSNRHAAVGKPS